MHTISVCNLKGGVGRTTLTYHLAAALAEMGRSVITIDADPQGCLTACFRAERAEGPTLAEVLRGQATVATAAVHTTISGVWLVPSSPRLDPIRRRNLAGDRVLVARMVDSCDFALIDCPSTPGVLLSNALIASDSVLAPVRACALARGAVGRMLTAVQEIRERGANSTLDVLGLLINQFDADVALAARVEQELREQFGPLVFEGMIHASERLAEGLEAGRPVTEMAPGSRAADEVRAAARELVQRAGARRGYFGRARRTEAPGLHVVGVPEKRVRVAE